MTYTTTRSESFTIVHARQLSSKVAADMHLCALYYGKPTEQKIREYAEELAQIINNRYLDEYEFGYKKEGVRVVTWRYKADTNGIIKTDDDPGQIVSYIDVTGASFFTYMTWNSKFDNLTQAEKDRFRKSLPIQRTVGDGPSDGNGYWTGDHNYHSTGTSLGRQTFQPYS
jgi:hypothetical protein